MFRDWLSAARGDRRKLATRINNGLNRINEYLNVSLVAEPTGAVRVRLVPRDLLGGLWLQLALKLSGQTALRACLHCGRYFEAGVGTARRADAKFCSDDHRIAFNSLKRSKEK
jgi:hypothetical protein